MPDSGRLNPDQGLALSMTIAGQCISLANHLSCDKASSFLRCDFWTRHDQLNEIIDNARKHGLAHFHSSTVGLDAVALSIQALLYASELCLYETAKRKSRDISVGAGFQSTSRQRWTSAMLEFIQVANQVNHVDGNKVLFHMLRLRSFTLTVLAVASFYAVGCVRSPSVMHPPASEMQRGTPRSGTHVAASFPVRTAR